MELVDDVPKKITCSSSYFSDGSEGLTKHFLHGKFSIKKESGMTATHLLLSNGSFHVPFDMNNYLFDKLTHDYSCQTMPPIVSVRTIVFNMYADFDLKIPLQELPHDSIRKMAFVINAQAQRFFPDDHPPLTLVVCVKSEPPKKPVETVASSSIAAAIGVPTVLYKHGIHFHWPDVQVKFENALHMRMSMMAALERMDWTSYLGVSTLDWNSVFDDSVYGTCDNSISSLRMVGAPKASKCSVCKGDAAKKSSCSPCNFRGHEIDPVHYKMFELYEGDVLNEDETRRLRNNFAALLRKTDIRCDEKVEVSKNWKLYPGCPPLIKKDGRKRKCNPDLQGVEKKFTKNPEIKDPEKEAILRKYLIKLSPHYANASMRILYEEHKSASKSKVQTWLSTTSNVASYKCPLRGDGANFCLNLKKNGGFHNSQNVYMKVIPKDVSKNEYEARMKCFCKCETIEGRYGHPCHMFESKGVLLDGDDANVLFRQGTSLKHGLEKAEYEYKLMKRISQ